MEIKLAKNTESCSVLQKIVGTQLTSVEFILDYVKLDFDNEGNLTSLIWPEIWISNKKFVLKDSGYRDMLCSLIGRSVNSVHISDDEIISIKIGSDSNIVIPISCDNTGSERAVFTAPGDIMFVWHQ